jgi:signal transduction histidine kinase
VTDLTLGTPARASSERPPLEAALRESERHRQVAESLRGILAVLNSSRPLDEVLDYIVREASRLLGSDTSALYRFTEPDGSFQAHTIHSHHADVVARLSFPPDLAETLRGGEPVTICNMSEDHPGDAAVRSQGGVCLADFCQALLAVPLLVTGKAYGALLLYYSEPQEPSSEEVALALAFSNQAALAIENARLREQAEEAAVLQERTRLAREMHDSVTQSLYSLTLLSKGWLRLAQKGELEAIEGPLVEVGEIAQQALKEMRLMICELRPPDLQEEGLLGALHHRLEAVEKRAGLNARLLTDEIVDLPVHLEEELYRIAVEALNNALKHAGATSLTVRIRASDNQIEMEIQDNGRGFDTQALGSTLGMGLRGMRERAQKLGGSLTIRSAPGQGTSVLVTAPSVQRAITVGRS